MPLDVELSDGEEKRRRDDSERRQQCEPAGVEMNA
jgi:hypothetical protein